MFNINFTNDWIRTVDLWYQKQPLYQLSHNHFPVSDLSPNLWGVLLINDFQ